MIFYHTYMYMSLYFCKCIHMHVYIKHQMSNYFDVDDMYIYMAMIHT